MRVVDCQCSAFCEEHSPQFQYLQSPQTQRPAACWGPQGFQSSWPQISAWEPRHLVTPVPVSQFVFSKYPKSCLSEDGSLKISLHRLLINYKGKSITLQWRNLVETTLTTWSSLVSPRMCQIDITCLLMRCTEKPHGITIHHWYSRTKCLTLYSWGHDETNSEVVSKQLAWDPSTLSWTKKAGDPLRIKGH